MIEETEVIKTDFYLKLASEADMETVLHDFYKQDTETTVDEETGEETTTNVGDPYLVPNTSDYAIDIVGTLYEPTGVILTDAEGLDYPEMQAITGWHVNIRLPNDNMSTIVDSIYETYGVTPESPSRVWL